MDKILESIKDFLFTGNNLTIVIVLATILLVLLLAIIITSIKKKNVEKKVAAEEAMLAHEENEDTESLDIETIVLSPVVDEEIVEDTGAVMVNNETASQVADETVIMTPVREKKRPIKKKKSQEIKIPQERVSSFGEPNPSKDDGKLPGTIQIYKDTNDKYRFRFRSSNNFTVGHSQAYTSKSACKSGIQAVIRVADLATVVEVSDEKYVSIIGKSVFEVYKDNDNKYRFRLMSQNAMNILASQGYFSKYNCLKGIESIRRIAEYHNIVDDTKI